MAAGHEMEFARPFNFIVAFGSTEKRWPLWRAVLSVLALGLGNAQSSAQSRIDNLDPAMFSKNQTVALNKNFEFECSAFFTVTAAQAL